MKMQQVNIRICGTQYTPEASAGQAGVRTESTAQGTYYDRNDAQFLLWEERLEGVDAPVRSRMKYRDGCLEVTRRGGLESHMVFETEKAWCADYMTPLGMIRMEIATDRVEMEVAADGTRRVSAVYRLSQDGQVHARCSLQIEIKPLEA